MKGEENEKLIERNGWKKLRYKKSQREEWRARIDTDIERSSNRKWDTMTRTQLDKLKLEKRISH